MNRIEQFLELVRDTRNAQKRYYSMPKDNKFAKQEALVKSKQAEKLLDDWLAANPDASKLMEGITNFTRPFRTAIAVNGLLSDEDLAASIDEQLARAGMPETVRQQYVKQVIEHYKKERDEQP